MNLSVALILSSTEIAGSDAPERAVMSRANHVYRHVYIGIDRQTYVVSFLIPSVAPLWHVLSRQTMLNGGNMSLYAHLRTDCFAKGVCIKLYDQVVRLLITVKERQVQEQCKVGCTEEHCSVQCTVVSLLPSFLCDCAPAGSNITFILLL